MSGYDESNVEGTVAAFMIMRGQHWFLSTTNGNSKQPATARLLTSDYGRPKGFVTPVQGKTNVFQRVYEKAIATFDCNNFKGSFFPSDPTPPPSPPIPIPYPR
jgi:hypothetical protein